MGYQEQPPPPPPPPPAAPGVQPGQPPPVPVPRVWRTGPVVGLAALTFVVGLVVGAVVASDDDEAQVANAPGDATADDADDLALDDEDENATTTTGLEDVGTRSRPVPLGTAFDISDGDAPSWTVKLAAYSPNAAEEVLAENQFNDPPGDGETFALFRLELTYNGPEESGQAADLSYHALGPSNVSYSEGDDSCGVIPEALDQFKDVFQGGTLTGGVCFSMTIADAAQALLVLDVTFSFDERKYFFATS